MIQANVSVNVEDIVERNDYLATNIKNFPSC